MNPMKLSRVLVLCPLLVLLFCFLVPYKVAYSQTSQAGTAALSPTAQTQAVAGCPDAGSGFADKGIYCMLTPIGTQFPGFTYNGNPGEVNVRSGTSNYLNSLYQLGVAVATGLALIYITIGGVQYASTDSVTGSTEGKKTIQNALLGLLVVLGSWVMLNAINPDLLTNSFNLTPLTPFGLNVNGDVNAAGVGTGGGGPTLGANGDISQYSSGPGYTGANVSTAGVQFAPGPGNNVIGSGNLAIDYDASPGAYAVTPDPDGPFVINGQTYRSSGYEDLQNACYPHCFDGTANPWYGIKTDSSGTPLMNDDGTLQGQIAHPGPGGTLNGDTTSFAVLTNDQYAAIKQINPNFKWGDQVILTNTQTGVSVYASAADNGGSAGINHMEMGPATAAALGAQVTTNKNGVVKGTSFDVPVKMTLPGF